MEDDQLEQFACQCYSPEHTCQWYLWAWDDDNPELEVVFYLHHHNEWYKRLWSAIKHVFGYKSNVFCGFMMRREDIPRFKQLIDKYEELKDRSDKKNNEKPS